MTRKLCLTALRWTRLLAAMPIALLAGCGAYSESVVETPVAPPPPREVASRLPILSVQTANGTAILSKDTYVAGSFTLTDTNGVRLTEGPLEIRGRGHSTWTLMPKKPYRVKLGSSAALLTMPANRHWVLLANYSDKTLMRNDIAFEFSRMLGMEYTPRSRFVDLELNGAYQGLYQLTEHVRIAPERVNIPEMKSSDTSSAAITGGYLIEVDERWGKIFASSPASRRWSSAYRTPRRSTIRRGPSRRRTSRTICGK